MGYRVRQLRERALGAAPRAKKRSSCELVGGTAVLNQVNDSYNSGPHPFPTSPDASAASHLSTRGMNKGVVSRYAAKRGSEP